MSVGVALLQSNLGNKTSPAASVLSPSIIIQQGVDLGASLLGLAAMATVALKRMNIFPNDPNLMVIAIVLCVISTFISLYELLIQTNFLLLVITGSSDGPCAPRLVAMLYLFLQDLRYWIVFSLFCHRILALILPLKAASSWARPIRGWLILTPAGLAPLAMISYGIVTNGTGFYFEETPFAEFFLFPAYSIPDWAYWLVDGVMVPELMISLIVIFSKNTASPNVENLSNFKATCIVFVYVIYHYVEKPVGFFMLASSWNGHQTLTTNLYSLLLPFQLIIFHWFSHRPVKVIPPVVPQPEDIEDTEMVPFEGGMKDPLLVEWNAAYDRYMEEKKRTTASRLPSTHV